MIKLNHINKYFNKGKSNEIHVINNTSLEFSKTGLVSILGASGSGKTTLLNVIGGLDNASGQIIFDNYEINNYNSNIWDKIRNEKIGYIFQNYHLIDTMSVYDNVKLSLSMLGINDEKEIEHKIAYVLNAVGMYRFRKKKASDLSGGQKQRVAIARALVKDPEVIIADEPTGNLDTNNSVQILKIIKEISKEKLVILVTHNKNLAANFSDRIIEVSDGSVNKDYINESQGNLDYIDHNIYLKDLNYANVNNINIYSNDQIENLNLTIIKINNNYYLQTSDNKVTIENINNSNKVLINKSKEDFKVEMHKAPTYNSAELNKYESEKKHVGIYKVKDSLIMAFKKLTNLGRRGKIQIVALIMLGMMFAVSLNILFSAFLIDESKIYVEDNLYSYDLADAGRSGDLSLFDDPNLHFYQNAYAQKSILIAGIMENMPGSFAPVTLIQAEDIAYNEVYIDESLLDSNYENSYILKAYGFNKASQLLGEEINVVYYDGVYKFKVVKTVKTNSKKVYFSSTFINELTLNSFSIPLKTIEYNNKKIVSVPVLPPVEDDKTPIYISEDNYGKKLSEIPEFGYSYPETNYYIAGYFQSDSIDPLIPDSYKYDVYIKNSDMNKVLKLYTKNNYSRIYNNINVYSLDGSKILDEDVSLVRTDLIKQIKKEKRESIAASLSQIIFSLVLSVLIFYFLVRSSLTERRKEISVLRALGIRKREVRKLFAFEYLIFTTFTSAIGVILGSLLTNIIGNSFLDQFLSIRSNTLFTIVILLLTYLINVFVGLIPISQYLRQTPAKMLTNYDM